MSPKLFRELFGSWLAGIIQRHGFEEEADPDGGLHYRRLVDTGSQAFEVPLWDKTTSVRFAVLVSVRLDKVEEVYHRFSGTRPRFQPLTSTVVTTFNYFAGGPAEVSISTSDELNVLLKTWVEPLKEEALPYLHSAMNLVTLDQLINGIPRQIMDITREPYSLMHHIIIAKLAGNPNFDQLAESHREEMETLNCDPAAYEDLVKYLKTL